MEEEEIVNSRKTRRSTVRLYVPAVAGKLHPLNLHNMAAYRRTIPIGQVLWHSSFNIPKMLVEISYVLTLEEELLMITLSRRLNFSPTSLTI